MHSGPAPLRCVDVALPESAIMQSVSSLDIPGEPEMPITVEAVYENGVLKPARPLPLIEQERVQVTVHTASDWVTETAGMIPWTGDHEALRRLAEDVEFDPQEQA